MFAEACKASCPAGFYEDMDEGRCGQCHPTCSRCSGPLADDCESCSALSPKLYKGSCFNECPTGTYYATQATECQGKIFGNRSVGSKRKIGAKDVLEKRADHFGVSVFQLLFLLMFSLTKTKVIHNFSKTEHHNETCIWSKMQIMSSGSDRKK